MPRPHDPQPANLRVLAEERMRVIFGQRVLHHLSPDEYRDYLSWVLAMVKLERQRIEVQLPARALASASEIEDREDATRSAAPVELAAG